MDTIASMNLSEAQDWEEEVQELRAAIRQKYLRIGDFSLYLYGTDSDGWVNPVARTFTSILGPATPIVDVLGPMSPYDLGDLADRNFPSDELVVLATVETERYTAWYVTSLIPETMLTAFDA
jgi:hypothetical protein